MTTEDHGPSLRREADRIAEELVAVRRDLHRHPELGFEETRTSGIVAGKLRELGLEVHERLARTGVAGLLRAGAGRGPAVLLRADMDALPIREVGGRSYGSTVEGRMHACGHDGHTAMLLGAAALLSARRRELPRDVVFCFQPAEEGLGGARQMIDDGVLSLVPTGAVYGLHLWSPFASGTVHVRPGPFMAAQDEFTARIVGRGGHGAQPDAARDPIVAASQAVLALQAIVAREVDPIEPAVLTVGSFQAGSAPNVIPETAELRGTMRSFNPDVRELLRRRVPETMEATARSGRCRVEFDLVEGYPALVNSSGPVECVREVARDALGTERVFLPPPTAAAEDFAYFLQERPGAFFFLGAGDPARGIDAPHHSPEFDIDESVLPRGTELLARLAIHPNAVGRSIRPESA